MPAAASPRLLALAVLLLVAAPAAALDVPAAVATAGHARSRAAAPDTRVAPPVAATLPALAPTAAERRARLADPAGGVGPRRNGTVRDLPAPVAVRLSAGGVDGPGLAPRAADGGRVLATSVVVEAAARVRVHLTDLALPAGTLVWAWGADGVTQGPLALDDVRSDDGAWTPPAAGPRVTVAAQLPAGATDAGFRVDRVAELLAAGDDGARSATGPCLEDFACVDVPPLVASAASAVGRMEYVSGHSAWVCTGGLLNDTDDASVVAWFLTAEHCIATESEAASLVVTWDDVRASCGGPRPAENGLPTSVGATLVAHGSASDFSLLRLSGFPGSRTLLGWSTTPPSAGETLWRVHHPDGDVRHVSTSQVCSDCSVCVGWPSARFLYQTKVFGSTMGGSSGSPLFVDRGSGAQVVGQLAGACGEDVSTPCGSHALVDGRFATTFDAVAEHLAPATPTTSTTLATPIPRRACRPTCRAACRAACATQSGRARTRCVRRCKHAAVPLCRSAGRCF